MSVYFIRPIGRRGPVKIGYSGLPERRLQTFMKWSPLPLEIAAVDQDCGASIENRLHEEFANDRLHFEWFSSSDKLDRLIEAVSSGVPLRKAMASEDIPTLSPYALKTRPKLGSAAA